MKHKSLRVTSNVIGVVQDLDPSRAVDASRAVEIRAVWRDLYPSDEQGVGLGTAAMILHDLGGPIIRRVASQPTTTMAFNRTIELFQSARLNVR